MTDFETLVSEMRQAQRSYFATREGKWLDRSKQLEYQVDKHLAEPGTTPMQQSASKQGPIRLDQAEWVKKTLTQLNLWSKKEEIVKEFSISNSVHIGELDQLEAEKLINYLLDLLAAADRQRKALLSIGYQLHWDVPRTAAEQSMEGKRINYNRVNAWCQGDHSKCKKAMNKMNPFELNESVTQLKQVLLSTKKEVNGAV